ncbi:MAG TPA: PEGA domain-containing protein [bacterium]|nr:PEGA domain-containing protein [bacterium]
MRRARVAKAPQNSVRNLRRSLRPRVSLDQFIATTIRVGGLIVFRTAAQVLVVSAVGLGVCFIPDVNAHVPQTKAFSATAASLVELVASEMGIHIFPGRVEAVQSQPSPARSVAQQRPAQFVATQAVLVTSTPGGAVVRLGGRTVGKTPLTLRIAPGTVTITFSRPGYASVTRTLTVKLGKAASVQVILTAASAPSTVTPPPQVPNPSGHQQTHDPAEPNTPQGGGTRPGD